MQIVIQSYSIDGAAKPVANFYATGRNAIATLAAIASGVQVSESFVVSFSGVVVLNDSGRAFCDFVRNLEESI